MNRTRKQSAVAAILISAIIVMGVDGCVHRKGSTTPVTTYEKVLAWNAALAEANKSVAIATMAAHEQKAIETPMAGRILSVQYTIAHTDQELTGLLELGPPATTGKQADVERLLGQIRDSAASLALADPNLGIKDPHTATAVKASIDTVFYLADLILRNVTTKGP